VVSSAQSRLHDAIRRIAEVTDGRAPSGVGHDDADDVEGTIASDDAAGFDPIPLLRSLDAQGARVVIIGQVAGILHGSTELTGDLDLLWSGDRSEAPSLAAAFSAVEAVLIDDNGALLGSDDEPFSLPKLQFRTATAAGDCCTPALPWGDLDIEGFLERAESTVVDGARLHYLTRPDLIAMRLAVGRPKDLRRVAELQSAEDS
jgi:hypothetical protein